MALRGTELDTLASYQFRVKTEQASERENRASMFRLLCLSLVLGVVLARDDLELMRELLRALEAEEQTRDGTDNINPFATDSLGRCRDDVMNPDKSTKWCIARYERGGRGPKIIDGMSGDDFGKLLENWHFNPRERVFVFARYETDNPYEPRTAIISWIGNEVTDEQKAAMRADLTAVKELMETQEDTFLIEVTSLDEMKYDAIKAKIPPRPVEY